MSAAVRVVLVEPQVSGNVGAAARALKNLGFGRLVLVRPACNPRDAKAHMMAVEAGDVLARAEVVETLDAALAGARTVVGLTRRAGRYRKPHYRLDECAGELVALSRRGELAAVFGREDNGLSDADLDRCTHLAYLAAHDDYPVFNLAQAVLLVAWELHLAGLEPAAPVPDLPAPAEHAERERMYEHLQLALHTIGYLHGNSVEPIMRRLRRLLGRTDMTENEVALLRGMAHQILWTAERAGLASSDDDAEARGR